MAGPSTDRPGSAGSWGLEGSTTPSSSDPSRASLLTRRCVGSLGHLSCPKTRDQPPCATSLWMRSVSMPFPDGCSHPSRPTSSRYAALEAALDFFDARAQKDGGEAVLLPGGGHEGPRRCGMSRAVRIQCERYKAVQEMLHFLDSQAARRASATSR